jgi:membrane protein DedA with SNARE-associated domain
MHMVASWLEHYGYGILFIALCLELMALPLPGEMLLSYTGILVFEGKLSGPLSVVLSGSGVIAGVSLSYWTGYLLGKPFLSKYGSRVHLGDEQLARMSVWFKKYGDKLLLVSFFIPGVRHITGYFCGVTHLPFRQYAVYAYCGGILWVSVFISLGTFLGPKWEQYHTKINRYILIIVMILALIIALIYILRKNKYTLMLSSRNLLKAGARGIFSIGRGKFLILTALTFFLLFAGCISLILLMIQNLLVSKLSD